MGSPVLGRELVVSRRQSTGCSGGLLCFFLGAMCTLRSLCSVNVSECFMSSALGFS